MSYHLHVIYHVFYPPFSPPPHHLQHPAPPLLTTISVITTSLQACGIATIVIAITHRSSVAGEEHVLVFSRLPTAHGQSADEAVRTQSLLDRGPLYLSGVGAIALILGLYGVIIIILRHSVVYLCSVSMPCVSA